jgi:hypothetical protein
MTGPDETTAIRQDLYLYVAGGPLVYTAPGQPIWDGVTGGGWYRAPDRLRGALADACVPLIGEHARMGSTTCWERRWAAKANAAKAPVSGRGKAAGRDSPSRDSLWPEAIAAATAAAGLVGVSGAAALRRARRARGGRVAPIRV